MKRFNFYEEQVREFLLKFEDENVGYCDDEFHNIVDLSNKVTTKCYKINSVEKSFYDIKQRCEGLTEDFMVDEYKIPLISIEKLKIYKDVIEQYIMNNVFVYENLEPIALKSCIGLIEFSEEMRRKIIEMGLYNNHNVLWMPKGYLKDVKFIVCNKEPLISSLYVDNNNICVSVVKNSK